MTELQTTPEPSRSNIGQRRLDAVLRTFLETGVVTGECKVDGPGIGQSAWCYSHGWSGAVQRCEWDPATNDEGYIYSRSRCPYWRIAAWIERRHEYVGVVA